MKLKKVIYYEPMEEGFEKTLKERLEKLRGNKFKT